MRQHFPVQPRPHVTKKQRHTHIQPRKHGLRLLLEANLNVKAHPVEVKAELSCRVSILAGRPFLTLELMSVARWLRRSCGHELKRTLACCSPFLRGGGRIPLLVSAFHAANITERR